MAEYSLMFPIHRDYICPINKGEENMTSHKQFKILWGLGQLYFRSLPYYSWLLTSSFSF